MNFQAIAAIAQIEKDEESNDRPSQSLIDTALFVLIYSAETFGRKPHAPQHKMHANVGKIQSFISQ